MLTLGIDTSTKVGSVALLNERCPLAEATLNIDVTHSERLLCSMDFILKNCAKDINDVDLISYVGGPGSFTGLRIGLSTAKGIGYSLNIPIIGVSSLKSLAMNVPNPGWEVCPMIDARKSEVYAAVYAPTKTGKLKATLKEGAYSPDELIRKIRKKTIFMGSGVRLYKNKIRTRLKSKALFAEEALDLTRGTNVALLGLEAYKRGKREDLDKAVPVYLRKSQAEVNLKRK